MVEEMEEEYDKAKVGKGLLAVVLAVVPTQGTCNTDTATGWERYMPFSTCQPCVCVRALHKRPSASASCTASWTHTLLTGSTQ